MGDEQIQVRRATAADAAATARLLHDFNLEYDEPTPGVERLTETLASMLGRGEIAVLLAGAPGAGSRPERSTPPAGLALLRFRRSLWSDTPEAHLQELYVVPELRGRGIGRALLEATVDAARAAGATTLDLNTAEADTAARALYESGGFSNREGGPEGPAMLFYEREL
jgi:ribosomal protein S18 acetylase RimI-like enzyme